MSSLLRYLGIEAPAPEPAPPPPPEVRTKAVRVRTYPEWDKSRRTVRGAGLALPAEWVVRICPRCGSDSNDQRTPNSRCYSCGTRWRVEA